MVQENHLKQLVGGGIESRCKSLLESCLMRTSKGADCFEMNFEIDLISHYFLSKTHCNKYYHILSLTEWLS